MIGDLFDSPWKVLIVAVVLIVLFGSKKLPDAARSLGKSMRILKTEVGSLHEDEPTAGAPAKSHSATPGPPTQLTAAPAPGQQTQIDALQQIRDLQRAATMDARPRPSTPARRQSLSEPGCPASPDLLALRREAVMAILAGAVQGARIVGERFVRSQRQQNPEGRMPLLDHIRELRNRVLKMALGLIAGMVAGIIFFTPVWNVIQRPLCSTAIRGHSGCHTLGINQLVLSGPLDAFYLRVKVAVIVGVIVSSPVWLYQIWAFAAPGLYAREKRWSYIFLGTAVPLFLTGVTLAYWSLGRSMHYLLGLTPGGVSNLIQVDQYLSFVMAMMLAFGLAFEVPLLIIMLNLAGILTHQRFKKWRRVMLFGIFLIAGMANPSPDPVTMLILGGGCAVLVEVAEVIVWSNDRRRARQHPSPFAGLADDELSPLDLDDTETGDGSFFDPDSGPAIGYQGSANRHA